MLALILIAVGFVALMGFGIGMTIISLYLSYRMLKTLWVRLTIRTAIIVLGRTDKEKAALAESYALMDKHDIPRWVPFFIARRVIAHDMANGKATAKA